MYIWDGGYDIVGDLDGVGESKTQLGKHCFPN